MRNCCVPKPNESFLIAILLAVTLKIIIQKDELNALDSAVRAFGRSACIAVINCCKAQQLNGAPQEISSRRHDSEIT